MESSPLSTDYDYCLNLLRSDAPDFYFADLLLPDACRTDAVVLHAFHVELTNITLAHGEPMAGQVRLQWWSDVLNGTRDQEAQGHPVARSLLSVIERHQLPVAGFEAKLQAHIFDLYNDPMGDRNVFEAYCGETRSCLFQWVSLVLGIEASRDLADASGHSGVATGVVNVLENMAHHHNNGQVYVPVDLLAALGMSTLEFLATPADAHLPVVQGLVDLAREHHGKAILSLGKVQSTPPASFKPLALVPLYLRRAERAPLELFKPRPHVSQLRRQWALWRF